MNSSTSVDFGRLGGPVYVGRANGEKAREKLKMSELDSLDGAVDVRVPVGTYSINSSYFLGLFGASVVHFGSRDAFLEHYRFQAPPAMLESINRHIERALREKGILKLE
jgi:hypothetical protein